uniref:Uncharacterized protein n=1 Tax=Arundo donax TaxID=35708 RepID=A0A0A9GKA9_ARUDO
MPCFQNWSSSNLVIAATPMTLSHGSASVSMAPIPRLVAGTYICVDVRSCLGIEIFRESVSEMDLHQYWRTINTNMDHDHPTIHSFSRACFAVKKNGHPWPWLKLDCWLVWSR